MRPYGLVLQKPQEQTDRLPPPRTLILEFTLSHTRFGRSHVHSIGQLTSTKRSDGAPELDDALRTVSRKKIIHYRQLYVDRPEPIVFIQLQWTLEVKFMMILVVYCFYMTTVKHRL